MVDPLAPDAAKLAALRDAIPATAAGIYLDTPTRGPLPAETAAAMREADDWELRIGRTAAGRPDDVRQRADEARAVLAALITAQPAETALLPGISTALSVAAWAPDWRPGDRALTTSLDSLEAHAALAGVAGRLGVTVDVAPLAADADAEAALAALAGAMGERTRLVLVSHVAAGTGLRMPVPRVAELARRHGAWLAVDGSQAVGAVPVNASELGVDFIAFAADRWTLGPEGLAGLWVGPRAMSEARPASFTPAARAADDARRLEVAELPRTALLGLARSVGWLEMYVGLEWALERAGRLAAMAHDGLSSVAGIEVLTPRASMATIVTFRAAGWTAAELADELGRAVFAILAALPDLDAVRAGVGWFNTEEELDRFIEAVRVIAAHTPSSLPRRRPLFVMPAPPADT